VLEGGPLWHWEGGLRRARMPLSRAVIEACLQGACAAVAAASDVVEACKQMSRLR